MNLSFILKLTGIIESTFSEDLSIVSCYAFCNLATFDIFFHNLPKELDFWTALFSSIEQHNQESLLIWMIFVLSKYRPEIESLIFLCIERCLVAVLTDPHNQEKVFHALWAIGNFLEGLPTPVLSRACGLFQDEPLSQIATFVNSHIHSKAVFKIFEILPTGQNAILAATPLRAMLMVLAGIPDEELRVNVLEFLTFYANSEWEIDAQLQNEMEQIVAMSLVIAKEGNFAERRSALQFLCAHAGAERKPEITKELYPVIGEVMLAKDGETLRWLLATVRDLMERDVEFGREMMENEEYVEMLEELIGDQELRGDAVLDDVLESIQIIIEKLG